MFSSSMTKMMNKIHIVELQIVMYKSSDGISN